LIHAVGIVTDAKWAPVHCFSEFEVRSSLDSLHDIDQTLANLDNVLM